MEDPLFEDENEPRDSILTCLVSHDFQEAVGYVMYFICGSTILTFIAICLLKSLEVI